VKAMSSLKARDGPVPPLPRWTTQVHIGAVFEGGHSYHAQVFRDKECLCHIVLAGVAIDAASADEVLAIRVRNWIEEFGVRTVLSCEESQSSCSHDVASRPLICVARDVPF